MCSREGFPSRPARPHSYTYVTVLEKRSNFAPNINFELGASLNRAISELQNGLSSMKNGQS